MGDNGNGNGNGQQAVEDMAREKIVAEHFKGCTVNINELRRQDGLIAESIDKSRNQGQGVIPTFINANSDDEVRQALKHCIWKNTEEQDKCIQALAVCRITGAMKGTKTILDRIAARSAGVNGYLMEAAFRTLSQTTFISKSDQLKKGKGEYSNRPTDPISK